MPDELAGVGTAVADAGAVSEPTVPSTDTGGGAGETPTGDTTGAEGTPEGIGVVEEPIEGADQREKEPTAEGDESEFEQDGVKIEQNKRNALKELKKVNPAAAKALTDDHFRAQSIIKELGAGNLSEAVNKVRQLAATVDSLGGEEGITNLNTEVEDYRREIGQFANGDPALLNELHESNKEAFVTMSAGALELIMEKSPELLDKAIMPAMVARLENAGMLNTLEQVLKASTEGDGQKVYDLTKGALDWLQKAKAFAGKQLEMKQQRNPEQEKLQQERQEFENQKQETYTKTAMADVNRLNNNETNKIAAGFFKDIGLKPEGRKEFLNTLNSRIWKQMATDGPYIRAAKAIRAKGDIERHVSFVHNKFNELLPDAFRKLRNEMYPNYKPLPKKTGFSIATPAAKGTANGEPAKAEEPKVAGAAPGTLQIAEKPPREQIDWEKTNTTLFISGRAFMKAGKYAGKLVKWSW